MRVNKSLFQDDPEDDPVQLMRVNDNSLFQGDHVQLMRVNKIIACSKTTLHS